MTYESSEISVASGRPIELYDIAMGITHWRLTSGPDDFEFLGHTYESPPCKRGEIEQTGEIPKDGLEVELPRGHALGALCVAGVPEEEITLTLYRGHGTFFVTYWRGFMTRFKFNDKGIPVCYFEPASSDLPFVGGRRRCMRLCGHRLFGYRCGLDKEVYKITGTIDTISGVTITATEFGAALVVPDVYGDLTKLAGCTYAANVYSSNALRSFDGNISSYWSNSTGTAGADSPTTNNWIYCKWTLAQLIKKIRIRPGFTSSVLWYSFQHMGGYQGILPGEGCMKHFRVAGSNNGSSWTTIPIMSWLGNCQLYDGEGGSDTKVDKIADKTEWIGVMLDNSTAYTYYRIWVYDYWLPSVGNCELAINEIEMIEADNAMSVYSFGAGGEIVVGTVHRTITAHVGNTITINRPFGSGVVVGSSFDAYPGCDHTPGCCRTKFENGINYGGLELLPTKNPYAGNLIY